MRVKKVQLTNFRNHAESSLEFSGGVNIITGANAQGKTSILEALSYVCLTKSFLQQSDKTMCRFGVDSFAVDATVESDKGIINRVRIVYEVGIEKKYFLDNNEIRKSSDVIGMFPIIVLSPGDFALTTGAPSERRKFVDMVLSQVSRLYLDELMEYRRALKQRNKLLLDGKLTSAIDTRLLAAWTDALVEHGIKVMRKREEFIRDFRNTFAAAYTSLVEYGEAPQLIYEPSFPLDGKGNSSIPTAESFRDALNRLAEGGTGSRLFSCRTASRRYRVYTERCADSRVRIAGTAQNISCRAEDCGVSLHESKIEPDTCNASRRCNDRA